MHRIRAGHNGVANAGDDEGSDIVFHAVLQNYIAVMAMNTAHKYRADAVQHSKVRNAFICRGGKHNLVLSVQSIFANQFFHALAGVVNHSRCLRRKNLEIRMVRVIRPDGCHNHLPDQRRNARQNVGQVLTQQPNHDVHNEIADRYCQELCVDDLGNALHGHQKSIVYASKDDEQRKEQRHHQIIALCVKWRCNVLCIVQIPAQCKRNGHQNRIQCFYDPQNQIVLKPCHDFSSNLTLLFLSAPRPAASAISLSVLHSVSVTAYAAVPFAHRASVPARYRQSFCI